MIFGFYRKDQTKLVLYSFSDDKKNITINESSRRENSCIERALRTGEAQTILDCRNSLFEDILELSKYNIVSYILIPLKWQNQTQGSINIGYREPNTIPKTDVDFLHYVADITSGFIQSGRLIEEQKQAQRESETLVAKLKIINKLGQTLSKPTHESEVIKLLAPCIFEILTTDRFSIAIYQNDCFEVWSTNHEGSRIFPFDGNIARVFTTGEPLLVPDCLECDAVDSIIMAKFGLRSGLLVPICCGGNIIGTLNIGDKTPNKFTSLDTEIMTYIGAFVGATLQNSYSLKEAQKSREHALEANKAKSSFLANMSHEFRTPMNGVMGMCELLLGTNLTTQQKQYIKTIQQSGKDLLTIINDVLDLSKIEAGFLRLDSECIDLHEVLDQVIDLLSPQVNKKSITIMAIAGPKLPQRVKTDGTRLRQIIVNLLGNAIKFTSSGYIILYARCRKISENHASVEFSVVDTGIGIPRNQIKKLGAPFIQSDDTTTNHYGGTGLGLSIVKKISHALEGNLRIRSKFGVGSIITAQVLLEIISTSTTSSSKKVCLEMDASLLRTLLQKQLEGVGIQISKDADLRLLKTTNKNSENTISVISKANPLAQEKIPLPLRLRQIKELHKLPSRQQVNNSSSIYPQWNPVSYKILVAEDNIVNQKVILGMLNRLALKADIASDGLQAVNAIKKGIYNLVFMDVHMPILDGIEVCRRVRDDTNLAQPYIVALTANATHGIKKLLLDNKFDDYISKPISLNSLSKLVKQFVNYDVDSSSLAQAQKADVG